MSKFLNKRKMVLILVVLFIAFIVLCVFFTPRFKNGSDTSNNMDVIKQDESIKKQDNITQEPVQEEKQEDPPKQEETKKQNNASNNQSNKKEPKNENKSDTEIETSKDTGTNKQDSVNINKTEDKVNKEETKQEPPKEVQTPTKNAWEELGISEYDYYNKPMWNWARIDFSINDYKTYDKTREACINKGEEYYEQGYGYSCTSINSYSGNYLGEMLKTF